MRDRKTLQMLGRLEASLHDSLAEVAFLFNPPIGKGATPARRLSWLHFHIEKSYGVNGFWATTAPANVKCQSLLRRAGYQQVHFRSSPIYIVLTRAISCFHFFVSLLRPCSKFQRLMKLPQFKPVCLLWLPQHVAHCITQYFGVMTSDSLCGLVAIS